MNPLRLRTLPAPRSLALLALLVATGAARTAAAQNDPTALDLDGAPTSGTVRVHAAPAPDPSNTNVMAGGTQNHPGCAGYISARPAVVLDATAHVRWLRVYVTSAQDTTLLVLGPDNQWRCADDTYGFNPSVDGPFARGHWRVWVGTAAPGAGVPAVVTVTAHRQQHPADAPVAATPGSPQNPFAAATAMAQQVVTGVTTGVPAAAPFANLLRAGFDPNQLPAALGALVRQPDAGVLNLDPTQLGQLGDLAGRGLNAQQLQSVANAMLGQGANPSEVFSPAQLGQLATVARTGLTAARLGSMAGDMLRQTGAAAPSN